MNDETREFFVPRWCIEAKAAGADGAPASQEAPQPIKAYRDADAYVLLGDPGAGKTMVFEREAQETDGCYVPAREFLTFDDRPDWHDTVLFIDALDEVRAGAPEGRTPFDHIRNKLERLGRPRFRLSCREADWWGAIDHTALEQVSRDGTVRALHLRPLGEEEIRAILAHLPDEVPDVDAFWRTARDRGLAELLANPQALQMLVKAVAGGVAWPETRLETWDMACCRLLTEHNPEHSHIAGAPVASAQDKLDAAGFLCAVQLLAGLQGFSLREGDEGSAFPSITALHYTDMRLLKAVLTSKLYTAGAAAERCEPIHRSVAEFLAGRYLASVVEEQGLPVGRVLALTTGADGGVFAELRGLHAWMAAFCKSDRTTLIDRDPLGVVLYGDVARYSVDDKVQVLDGLRREATKYAGFRAGQWVASPFGALCTPDMEPRFSAILASPDRGDAHQALVDCVLDALAHGEPMPALLPVVDDIVRDATRWPHVRCSALEVLVRYTERDTETIDRLKWLLADVASGVVADADDELLGTLLGALYPRHLSPAGAVMHLHAPKQESLHGAYRRFWRRQVLERSSGADVAALADALVQRSDLTPLLHDALKFGDFLEALLTRVLEANGDAASIERMSGWLDIALDKRGWTSRGGASLERIREWLNKRPHTYKAVLAHGIREGEALGTDAWKALMRAQARLFHTAPPADIGRWYLEQAGSVQNDALSERLLAEAMRAMWQRRGDAGLSLELVEEAVERRPTLHAAFEHLSACEVDASHWEHVAFNLRHESENLRNREAFVTIVLGHLDAVRSGRGPMGLLNHLAQAYYGILIEAEGETPEERLNSLLGEDGASVDAVIAGLQAVLRRDDLPSTKDILKAFVGGKEYLLGLPYLAGLDELARDGEARLLTLTDEQLDRAIVFHLVHATGTDPAWLATLVRCKPERVAAVLVQCASAALRLGKDHIAGIYELAHDNAYAEVARRAALPLLARFPPRARGSQLGQLHSLLHAALRHVPTDVLRPIIESKLELSSMQKAQRVYWLAAGLVVDPPGYESPVRSYVAGKSTRIQGLAGFFVSRWSRWSPASELPETSLGLLVEMLGSHFAPYRREGVWSVTPAMEAAEEVEDLIERLSRVGSQAAADELKRLLAVPSLIEWRNYLKRASYRQAAVLREAGFRRPGIEEVTAVLANLQPANAADLAALTVSHLIALGREIRDGNANTYRHFWNTDGPYELTMPRPEEDCRNLLLTLLRARLKSTSVDAQLEGHYADDKRADIRVSYGGASGFNVPIEIKKNDNRELWSAIRSQLMKRYVRDPQTGDQGIYLVLWFGPERTPPPREGSRPRTPVDLRTRLLEPLTDEERHRIHVCVIDCSKPARRRGGPGGTRHAGTGATSRAGRNDEASVHPRFGKALFAPGPLTQAATSAGRASMPRRPPSAMQATSAA